jgi:hypothetical protein
MAGATRLVTGASGAAPDGGVRFPGEFSVVAGAFAIGQVLNFGSLAYIADCYDELRPLHGAAPAGNKPSASPPLLGLLGANLEVLARQIQCGLGLNPTVSDRRQMFYMLANVHHQIATGEVLSLPDRFWYYLPDLPFGIQNAAASFQLELEHLIVTRRHRAPSSPARRGPTSPRSTPSSRFSWGIARSMIPTTSTTMTLRACATTSTARSSLRRCPGSRHRTIV